MKNVFNFLTLLFFNNVFSQVDINTVFPKATLDTLSQKQNQPFIEERITSTHNTFMTDDLGDVRITKALADNLSITNPIFTSSGNINDFLQSQAKQIISFLTGTFPLNVKV